MPWAASIQRLVIPLPVVTDRPHHTPLIATTARLRWRNAAYRSSFSRSVDENRLILSYSIPLR